MEIFEQLIIKVDYLKVLIKISKFNQIEIALTLKHSYIPQSCIFHINLIIVFKNSASCTVSYTSSPSTARLNSPSFRKPSTGIYNSDMLSTMKSLNAPSNISISIFTSGTSSPAYMSKSDSGNSACS